MYLWILKVEEENVEFKGIPEEANIYRVCEAAKKLCSKLGFKKLEIYAKARFINSYWMRRGFNVSSEQELLEIIINEEEETVEIGMCIEEYTLTEEQVDAIMDFVSILMEHEWL